MNGENADDLALSKWREPTSDMIALACRMFRDIKETQETTTLEVSVGPAVRSMGIYFPKRLELRSRLIGVTAATFLIWAWGQALAEATGVDSVIVEQLRAGAPQLGTAGFTMNTLPVVIHRSATGEMIQSLRDLRARLLALREIEAVSPDDFSPGIFPNMDVPGTSMIMIERATLRHAVGASDLIESLVLHQGKGETLIATAYLLPDLQLEVEGPGRHHLLEAWIGVMERGIDPG